MFALKIFKKIIIMFQSDISPNQVAWGFALGAMLGLVPNMMLKIILFIVIMLFKVNLTAAILSSSLFAIISFALDPLFDMIGYWALNISALNSFYTWVYNLPMLPFTNFNNTVVMGSVIIGIILFAPNGLLAKKGIVYYRTNYRDKVSKWKIIKLLNTVINASKVVKIVK